MKILMITGSPRRKGTSNTLAARFEEGALAAGHTVERFDAARAKVGGCKACYYCRKHDGECAQKDDMIPLLGEDGKIMSADLIVFVTPLYYFGMSAQLKAVLDRFYALGRKLRERDQKAILLATAGDDEEWVVGGLAEQFRDVCRWAHWQETGMVLALGCHEVEQLTETSYPDDAYRLGASLV